MLTARDRKTAPVFRTLVLVRHGDVDPSLGLSRLGRLQAARTGHRLRTLPVSKIYCSTMKRACETAAIVAKHHKGRAPVRARLLQECVPGAPRGVRLSPEVRQWIRRSLDQVDRAYRRFFRPPATGRECEILVCHGNIIRYLIARALGADARGWYGLGTSFCGITVVRILRNGSIVVDRYNDTGHLSGLPGDFA